MILFLKNFLDHLNSITTKTHCWNKSIYREFVFFFKVSSLNEKLPPAKPPRVAGLTEKGTAPFSKCKLKSDIVWHNFMLNSSC